MRLQAILMDAKYKCGYIYIYVIKNLSDLYMSYRNHKSNYITSAYRRNFRMLHVISQRPLLK